MVTAGIAVNQETDPSNVEPPTRVARVANQDKTDLKVKTVKVAEKP